MLPASLRYSLWIALVIAVILAIFCAGAGQWLLAGVNLSMACINAVILYETRQRH